MFQYDTKADVDKCWNNAHSAKVKQFDAFLQYLSYLTLQPADLLHTRYFIQAAYLTLLALPVTIPLAVLTSPIFFVSRRVSVTKQRINNFLENRKQQKVINLINQNHQGLQKQISPELWQKAVQQATTKLFIQNKKRMIVVNQVSQLPKKQQQQKRARQFIFILDQDKSLLDVLYLLKKQIKTQIDSIYLILDSKILNSSTKITSLKSNNLGIIRLNYTKIETFG